MVEVANTRVTLILDPDRREDRRWRPFKPQQMRQAGT